MEPRNIGILINSLLLQSEEVKGFIHDRIYPFPALENTAAPFVAYTMTGFTPHYTKDRASFEDDVVVQLIVVSQEYEEKIKIADACYKALHGKRGEYAGFRVSQLRILSESEDFDEGIYVQLMEFEIQLDKL